MGTGGGESLSVRRILRLPDVIARTGLAKSTVYKWMKKGTFPRQFKMGTRAAGWLESEIDSWIGGQAE